MKWAALPLFLFLASSAAADDDLLWQFVHVDTLENNVVAGHPVTVRLIVYCGLCTSPTPAMTFPVTPTDVISWSFGDGSPDVDVTGSAIITHAFPRGWYDVTARISGHTVRQRIFSAPVFVDPPSYVSFLPPASVSEGSGVFLIHLERSGNLGVSSTIGFSLESNAPVTPTEGTVTFAPGETVKDIAITLVDNNVYDGPRGVTVTVWSVDGATLRTQYVSLPYAATFKFDFGIQDDEPQPTIRVDDVTLTEGNEGYSAAVFTVTLSAAASRDLDFSYLLTGGTATAGSDYVRPANVPQPLRFPAGVTSIPISIPIVADRVPEPDETFRFQITYANAFHPVFATCTIQNDDAALIPDSIRASAGTRATLVFDVGNPVAADTPVVVSSTSPEIVAVPSVLTLPAGSARLVVPLDARRAGAAEVQATAGNLLARAHVEVVASSRRRSAH